MPKVSSPPNDRRNLAIRPGEKRRNSATRAVTKGRYSQAMTDLDRGARVRRGGRRPGWVLLTALLVLAIGASSALVFTNQVELLKLAVILALWAAVVAAFVSVIYRRQSDVDQARARDLKLVYDLQLDREISARREYELTVESQLRRELTTELRAQANDEVSELRAELAALRTNLEILFDAELSERPALEGERKAVRGYSEWERGHESARERVNRVASVRAEEPRRSDDNSIIDVHEEPLVPTPPRQPAAERYQQPYPPPRQDRAHEAPESEWGSHRRTSDQETFAPRYEPPPAAGWTPPQAPPPPPTPVERPQEGPSWAQQRPQGQPSGWVPPGSAPRTEPERFEPPAPPLRSHRRAEAAAEAEPQFSPPQAEQPQRIPWPPTEPPRQSEQPPEWQPAYHNAPSRERPQLGHRASVSSPPSRRPSARAGIRARRPNRRRARAANRVATTGANPVDALGRGTLSSTPIPPPDPRPRPAMSPPPHSTAAAPDARCRPRTGDVAAATGQRSSSQHRCP